MSIDALIYAAFTEGMSTVLDNIRVLCVCTMYKTFLELFTTLLTHTNANTTYSEISLTQCTGYKFIDLIQIEPHGA